jgi:penicillin-binding protein-related factor A (putative recombinase)
MSRAAGWEVQLDHWHAGYRARGEADVQRVHPGVKVLGKPDAKGQFRACWAGVGPVDYLGILADGRAVAFDAKSCAAASWSRSVIPDHQAALLTRWSEMGAVAGIALQMPTSRWWLSWAVLRDYERPTLRIGDLERIGRAIGEQGWLSCL